MTDADPKAAASALSRRQLPSLLALRPYLARHTRMVLVAVVALVASAAAMLAVPLAVRRMIDCGFAAQDGVFIDRYFVTLIGIGAGAGGGERGALSMPSTGSASASSPICAPTCSGIWRRSARPSSTRPTPAR